VAGQHHVGAFGAIDDATLLGVMDMRGMARPSFFVLRRDS
jgi:hypothetical protein